MRTASAVAVVLAAFGFLAVPGGAGAAPLISGPNAPCFSCHGVPGLVRVAEGGRRLPLDVDPGLFDRSVHGRRPCASCHRDAVEIPHPAGLEKIGCRRCHGEERYVEGRFHQATTAWVEGDSYTMPLLTGDVRNVCLTCHGRRDVETDSGPVVVDVEHLAASVHKRFSCLDCHPEARRLPHPDAPSIPCARCHQDEARRWRAGRHAEVGESGPNCVTCHGRHDVLPPDDPRSRTFPLHVIETCGGCHEKILGVGAAAGHSPVEAYRKSVHADGIFRAGLVNSAVCHRCHGAHDVFPSSDPRSRTNAARVAETCGACHEGILEKYRASIHGRLLAAGDPRAPSCNDCHSSHEIAVSRRALDVQILRTGCGHCHESRKLTYEDTFHGKSTSLGFLIAATCADCHSAHEILPASDTASWVHPDRVVGTCRQCHPNADERIASFRPHADPGSPDSPGIIRIVFVGMNLLLFGTLAFFGLHTLLWLQRSIVGWRRGEVELEGLRWAEDHGPHVKRFTEVQRLTHFLVIVSFLTLAATGLPLHFHHERWAQWVARFLGGVEVTRFLHRGGALITVGYFGIHFAALAARIWRERSIRVLIGPDSLVPRLRDVENFLEHLRWCLYLGPRAKVDRWTYWEKFDYMAIFWGVPIIGTSGLVLWFPEFFSSLIPGIGFNLASIIHGDEALLATSFIFIVHFFHTHLRPEAFPIDVSVFTGTVPLERFKRERPEHYERLLAEGTLEKMLVPAPPPEMAHAAIGFGFSALAVGLLLIAATFLTVFL